MKSQLCFLIFSPSSTFGNRLMSSLIWKYWTFCKMPKRHLAKSLFFLIMLWGYYWKSLGYPRSPYSLWLRSQTCPGKASRNPSVISTRIPQLSYHIKNLKSISPTLIMKEERLASVSTMQYASLWGQGARGGDKYAFAILIPLSRTLAPNWTIWASNTLI